MHFVAPAPHSEASGRAQMRLETAVHDNGCVAPLGLQLGAARAVTATAVTTGTLMRDDCKVPKVRDEKSGAEFRLVLQLC